MDGIGIIGCLTIYSSIDFLCNKKLLASSCIKDLAVDIHWFPRLNCTLLLYDKRINSVGDDANVEGNQWTCLVNLSNHFSEPLPLILLTMSIIILAPCTSFLSPAQKTLLLHFCILLRGDDSFVDIWLILDDCTLDAVLRNTMDL